MTLRYRPQGEAGWKQGIVENISRSGVLFRAESGLELKAPVDISLALEASQKGAAPAVLCLGEIVRSMSSEGQTALAAKILDYNFVRPGAREAFDAAIPLATGDSN